MKFKNLKFLSLQNFKIDNYQTNIINRIKSLKAVQFTDCKLVSKSTLLGNLELVSFTSCSKFNIKYISNLKNLEVLKFGILKRLNLKGIDQINSAKKIDFKQVNLVNSKELLKLPYLESINLSDCKYPTKVEYCLKAKGILVENSVL